MAKATLFTRWVRNTALALSATLALSAGAAAADAGKPIVFATKSFTEQHILSAMTTMYLRKKGFQIEPKTNIATTIGRNAMINKQVDMTWEYTGTSLIIFNHINKQMSPQEAYDTVKKLDSKLGLVWLNPAPMNNTYAFAMQRKRAEAEHIETMSQLVAKVEEVRKNDPDNNWLLGLDLEFSGRSDGMKPLQKAYNMPLDRPQIRQMDPGLVYNAIRDGFVDAGLVYTTDGRVKGFDLKVLTDDKGFFPSYAVTPVVTKATLDSHPGLEEALNSLSPLITDEAITEMNKRVDIDHQSPQQVASDFLKSKGLL
ncbi:glycine betaine ABC transporter substrate-binding protein [Erwinia sp. 9145]|uniref:glycine betaine ABC transporter substrate-binding protein n=1 Tax=Erwinia sp. 9145 TaxID=1500895 RepID=UPI0005572965|nr:glycine betaine ABC transporter substrate-binding protein [Erwinia sp. 9145]